MKQIVLIEDSAIDTLEITNLLTKISEKLPYTLKHFHDLNSGFQYIASNKVDLLLLDLEFTAENRSAVSIIDDLPIELPIIIISNLSHFQKSLSSKINIQRFIFKENMNTELLPYVLKSLGISNLTESQSKEFIFPAANSNYISESINVNNIRYIEFRDRKIYKVYMIDGLCRTIYSLPFRDICNLLLAGGFSTLRPVTKNQIINTDHIRTISKADNGRIEITLINLPEKKFYVGNKHQKYFDIFL